MNKICLHTCQMSIITGTSSLRTQKLVPNKANMLCGLLKLCVWLNQGIYFHSKIFPLYLLAFISVFYYLSVIDLFPKF